MRTVPEIEEMLRTMERDAGIDRLEYFIVLGRAAFEKYKEEIEGGRLNGLEVGVHGDGGQLSILPLPPGIRALRSRHRFD